MNDFTGYTMSSLGDLQHFYDNHKNTSSLFNDTIISQIKTQLQKEDT